MKFWHCRFGDRIQNIIVFSHNLHNTKPIIVNKSKNDLAIYRGTGRRTENSMLIPDFISIYLKQISKFTKISMIEIIINFS